MFLIHQVLTQLCRAFRSFPSLKPHYPYSPRIENQPRFDHRPQYDYLQRFDAAPRHDNYAVKIKMSLSDFISQGEPWAMNMGNVFKPQRILDDKHVLLPLLA